MNFELQDFGKDVVEASNSVPVVVDFWAEWCGPCRQLSPILEKLAGEAEGKWKLVKIDTDNNPEIAAQFNIRGIPAVKMVYQSQIVAEFTGAQPEHVVRQWLEEHLPEGKSGNSEEVMNQVEALLKEGNRQQAVSLLASGIDGGATPEELVKYAMLLLPDDVEKAGALIKEIDQAEKFEIEFETLKTIRHLKEIALGNVTPASDNKQAAESYVNGAEALFKKDFEKALQQFIQTLQLDRQLDDDGARKACIACFTMLSQEHPLTTKYRRQFSMSLY